VGVAISLILEKKYPGYFFSDYPTGVHDGEKAGYILSILLNTEEGRDALFEYIKNGKLDNSKMPSDLSTGASNVMKRAFEAVTFLGTETERVLKGETKENHDLAYQKAIGK
jgi:hypothetical protein